MKRRLRMLAFCLLLGALTTVFVAWACALSLGASYFDAYVRGTVGTATSGWYVTAYRSLSAHDVRGTPVSEIGEREERMHLDRVLGPDEIDWPGAFGPPSGADGYRHEKIIAARGWPLPALWSETLTASERSLPPVEPSTRGGVRFEPASPSLNRESVTLPFLPIWKGLAVDTLFYAAIWVGVLALRRTLRQRVPYIGRRAALAGGAVCLALGLVTTVVEVVLCALMVDLDYTRFFDRGVVGESRNGPNYGIWEIEREERPGALRLYSRWHPPGQETGFSWPIPDMPAEALVPGWAGFVVPDEHEGVTRVLDARGWPMLAMWGGFEAVEKTVGETTSAIMRPHILDLPASGTRMIPLAPIWLGFLVDAFFFAAVLAVLLVLLRGPGVVVATVRHLRGRCAKCGYPIGESAVCTECGAIFSA